jgi:serine protease
VEKVSQRVVSTAVSRAALVAAALIVLAACRTAPGPQAASIIVTPPPSVWSGDSVDVQVAIARGDVLGEEVVLTLGTDADGIAAEPVTTTAAVATLTITVDEAVPAGTYPFVVVATSGTRRAESGPVSLEVGGPEPGSLAGELRSLLIPTPGNVGLPNGVASFAFVSMVPGKDVPIEFDEMRAVPGEVLVRFRPDAAVDRLSVNGVATLAVAGVRLQRPSALVRVGRLEKWVADAPMTIEATIELAAALRARPDVATATPNWLFSPHQAARLPLYPLQWNYPAIDLHAAWQLEFGESNPVVVAVLDTGYQQHVDLQGIWLPGFDLVDLDDDPTEESTPENDHFSHGTHVSGIIAMRLANDPWVAGVSRGASIVPIRFIRESGRGTTENLLAGMVWASGLSVPGYDYPEEYGAVPDNANPARVINMSVGGRIGPCPEEMASVTQSLTDQSVILVASAGNSSQDSTMFSPANCPGVITVGATGPYDERAYYSNYGPHVDLFAPGGNADFDYTSEESLEELPAGVLSTTGAGADSSYAWTEGTSMAAPHVSGLAALLLSADPTLTRDEVLFRMTSTATPLTLEKCDRPTLDDCGAGLVNANLALGGSPAPAWEGAPTVSVGLHACDDEECNDLDAGAEPLRELSGALTRGYWPFDFGALAPGTYALVGTVVAPQTVLELQSGIAVVEVVSGDAHQVVLDLEPGGLEE